MYVFICIYLHMNIYIYMFLYMAEKNDHDGQDRNDRLSERERREASRFVGAYLISHQYH